MRALTSNQTEAIRDVIDAGLTRQSGAALEKDIHLTQALIALGTLGNAESLTFCGGTSLSKCFNLIDRMSEDADFKFHLPSAISKNASANERSLFRTAIIRKLAEFDFEVELQSAKDSNRYFQITAGFAPVFAPDNALRDSILLEFTHVARPPKSIKKGIHEFVSKAQLLDSPHGEVACLTLEQTLAEKTLSFLRRALYREAPDFDPRIVRHLYDIEAIISKTDVNIQEVYLHFEAAIDFDAARYSNETPSFRTLLDQIEAEKQSYRGLYSSFVSDLTVDFVDDFEKSWDCFAAIASKLLELRQQATPD
jgi:predicted nucleotidyltransferase component of viral defense system